MRAPTAWPCWRRPRVFLNAAAQQALGPGQAIDADSPALTLHAGLQQHSVRVAGVVAAGAPLTVMDIGAAQD